MINPTYRRAALALLSVAMAACSNPDAPDDRQLNGQTIVVNGSVAYRERIAMPTGSVVTITLNDVSRADIASTELARQSIVTSGEQVPIAFELTVDQDALRPGMTYALRAVIRDSDDELLWTTDTVHRVEPAPPESVIQMGTIPLVRVAGSATTSGEVSTGLDGTRWAVVTIADHRVNDNSRAELIFGSDGSLSGNASCNSFSGSYSLSDQELTVGQLAVTMMACPDQLSELERNFLSILTGTSRFSINAEGLMLITSDDGDSIVARRAPDERSLAGSNWSVSSIAGNELPEDSPAELRFGEDGNLSGSTGCNRFTGSFKLDGNELLAESLAVTRMACPEPQAGYERDFLQILGEPCQVSFDAPGALVITSPAGKTITARGSADAP